MRIEHLRADLFGLSELQRRALSGKLELPGLVVARKLEHIPRVEDQLLPDERAHLARWLEARLAPHSPPVAALDAVRSLAQPGACFVVTGQQPGLFHAPLLTLWKSLQTIVLARQLSEQWGTPVVPLFWNHADDHDVAEVHHGYFVNPNLDVQKVVLPGFSSGRQPLSRLQFDQERHSLTAVRALLRQIYGYMPQVEASLDLLMPRHGESFPSSFTRAHLELLGHLGMIVVEPDWIREDLTHHLAQLVGRDLIGALSAGENALAEAGFEPAISVGETALLYRVDAGGREPLRAGGEGYAYDQEPGSRTGSELAAELVQDPGAWSAGALLRPLLQDLALPVAAYVGGPGELAYHAQLAGTRSALGLPHTPFVPRVSITLIDEENARSLTKLGARLGDVLSARGEYNGPPEQHVDPIHGPRMRELALETRTRMLELRKAVGAFDKSLEGLVKRTADKVGDTIGRLGDKITRVESNRSGKGRRHLRRVNHSLCPKESPQERVLGPLAFLATYGSAWLDELTQELEPFASEHLAVFLEASDRASQEPSRT